MKKKVFYILVAVILSLCLLTFLTYQVLLFIFGSQYKNESIWLAPVANFELKYRDADYIIANNVLTTFEHENKIYYITKDGIGVFDEDVSLWDHFNKNVHKYNTFISKAQISSTIFNPTIEELYPEFNRFSNDEQQQWKLVFSDINSKNHGDWEGRVIRRPIVRTAERLSPKRHWAIVDISTGVTIANSGDTKYVNNCFYNVEFGILTKIDFTEQTVTKYYSERLLLYHFSKNDKDRETLIQYDKRELRKNIDADKERLPSILGNRFIVLEDYSDFTDADKKIFQEMIVDAVNRRQALELNSLQNQSVEDYLTSTD